MTIQQLKEDKLIAVIRTSTSEEAESAAKAAFAGGIRYLEITHSVPDACKVIRSLCEQLPNAIVGAGTVLNTKDLADSLAAGARFQVSPHFDPELVKAAISNDIFYIPGTLTPSEGVAIICCAISRRGGAAMAANNRGFLYHCRNRQAR